MGVFSQASVISDTKGSFSTNSSSCFFICFLNSHKDCQEKLNNKLSWNNWNFLQKVSHSFPHVLKQQTMTVSKMFYDTHTGEVTDNKTWTASGNTGGLQTHAFCHN